MTENNTRNPSIVSLQASRRTVLKSGLVIGLLGAVPGMGALAGCSSGESTGTSAGLSFWSRDSYVNGALEPLLRARLAEFDSANNASTGLVYLSFADSTQKELASFAAHTSPTIGEQGPDVALEYAAGGHLAQVNDVYTKLRPNLLPLLQQDFLTKWKGNIYAIPWYLQVDVLYSHEDLLAQDGVSPPTTWQEWLDTATSLTHGSKQYGFVTAGADTSAGQLWIPLATSAGGALLDESGMLTSDQDPFVAAMDFLYKLYKAAMPPASITYMSSDAQELFLLKKAATVVTDASVIPAVQQASASGGLSNLGANLIPVQSTGDMSRSFLGGFELFLFAGNKPTDTDLGAKLIEYLLEPPWYTQYVKTSGGFALPVLQESTANPYFSTGLIGVLTKQAETSYRYGGPNGDAPYLGVAESAVSNGLYSSAVVEVWSGKSTPKQAVANFFSQLTALAKSNTD
jgi:ABC-type glycerol-3-phosphate transport system substrate-binding protein